MSQKTQFIPGIGEVLLVKRRDAKNIRLSVNAAGKVRVSMPFWSPYQAGILFAKSRKEWLKTHIAKHQPGLLTNGVRIGKFHRVEFRQNPRLTSTTTQITDTVLTVSTPLDINASLVQQKARQAAEKVLKKQAEQLLPQRLMELASKHSFSYKEVKVRKMTSRWGSCSSKGTITLSYYLIQLPWPLIDYVLIHELVHTKHMNHSKEFWASLANISPNYKVLRKQVHEHRPALIPNP